MSWQRRDHEQGQLGGSQARRQVSAQEMSWPSATGWRLVGLRQSTSIGLQFAAQQAFHQYFGRRIRPTDRRDGIRTESVGPRFQRSVEAGLGFLSTIDF